MRESAGCQIRQQLRRQLKRAENCALPFILPRRHRGDARFVPLRGTATAGQFLRGQGHPRKELVIGLALRHVTGGCGVGQQGERGRNSRGEGGISPPRAPLLPFHPALHLTEDNGFTLAM